MGISCRRNHLQYSGNIEGSEKDVVPLIVCSTIVAGCAFKTVELILGSVRSFFFFSKMRSVTHSTVPHGKLDQPNRSSRKTSCSVGSSEPIPALARRSMRDMANALAAVQANMQLHLLNQANSIRFWMTRRR